MCLLIVLISAVVQWVMFGKKNSFQVRYRTGINLYVTTLKFPLKLRLHGHFRIVTYEVLFA